MALTWLLTTTAVMTTLLAAPASAIHECNSVFIHDVFRCNSDKRLCLATKDLVCREPMLSTGIYDQCPDNSNQWRGLCDRICYSGFRMRRGFKCGDGYCETNFMKWCDGKVDCPNDNADEAHCNCTARPTDCLHYADSRRGLVSSQYLFRRVFAPMGFFVIILVIWKYYRTMKLRQRLASLHNHPDVRLCDADVVYVGGVTELARRNNNRNRNNNNNNNHLSDSDLDPVMSYNLPSYVASTIANNGPPPYQGNGDAGGVATQPIQPPSYQESIDPQQQQRMASNEGNGVDESSNMRVALPPLSPPIQLDDPNLPPPPPYESVAKKADKGGN